MVSVQTVLPLYEEKIHSNLRSLHEETDLGDGIITGVANPRLLVFTPVKSDVNKPAVIICPGGAYAKLSMKNEGSEIAGKLNELGVTAFVLKYRLPNDLFMENKEMVPLQDAQRAIQLVREKAKEFNVDPDNIGIMGFSAGGHLASTAGTHFDKAIIPNEEKISLRPDFMVLIYPVISFDGSVSAHKESVQNLIGTGKNQELVHLFSNELQVTPETPPTFLVHAADDNLVPVTNSTCFHQALIRHKVSAEIHIYEKGGHGFGLHNGTADDRWFDRLVKWMRGQKIISS